MSSSIGLRARSNHRPLYTIDESDDDADILPRKKGKPKENIDRSEIVSSLNDIDKILDCDKRSTVACESDATKLGLKQNFVKQYLVKWKGLSYLHCTWVPEEEFLKAFKNHPGLKTKINNFHRHIASANNPKEDFVAIRPEWTMVDRILACRGHDDKKEYLVKWKELPYDECYWELKSDICAFQTEIKRFNTFQSRSRKLLSSKKKRGVEDDAELNKQQKEFLQYEHSLQFLSGGALHSYQLEGLNFLRFSWSKQTHVILADEMGLGKTIQSIAFLASLFEENVSPHLVVAPLSTLRNWEREFATWAPQMNVIVDEGHRLKNKDSKLFSSLKQYSSKHRVLLTGTPLQNNLDELFMLMHFLDAGKFGSLEEFQVEFKDINREEQILRLHKMLAPHLLRRMKKDVMKELPPKKELILRVELCSKQKEYYKAILTRNYQILTRQGGAQISLINVVMELRKLCCHPYMLQGVQPDLKDAKESYKQFLESSGKLQLLDKMMVKLKEQGHRVLIYSQFQHMLDLLEDYCVYKRWQYERIDGKVGGAERQVRIDRFNAKNSSRFCFLLSTRAGGLGINLTTADTVIIYDSDWNPHADLQAMARAHRLGQTNKVMIYRLITRGTIEERMIQITKKKMVLEHLVVGNLKAQNINQEELDDIVRYGSKELFADENDEVGKSRLIHYDDEAIDRLLDRDQVGDEKAAVDGEDEDGFLKAFKVANFEYVEDVEPAEEVAQNRAKENQSSVTSSKRTNYWEELLKNGYEENKVEELNALGKGKRNRNKWLVDGFSGLEDVSSDGEDDNYKEDRTDDDSNSTETTTTRRPHKKKARADNMGPLPLMEGEGRSLKVLGFNQNQRAAFVQILMRFGVGDFDWKEFTSRMKQKSYEEIVEYGKLFLSHIAEDITDSPTFTDGVPKEGLRIKDVLVRIAVLLLIRDKVKFASENPRTRVFSDDILLRYAGLNGANIWKEEHDLVLLHAVLKHGYGRWHDIVDDKDLKIQEVITQELNIPFTKLPVQGQVCSQVYNSAKMTNVESGCSPIAENDKSDIADDGANMTNVQSSCNQSKESGVNDIAAEGAHGSGDSGNQAQFRDMQRRHIEFIKKRFLLLEKGLNAEYQKEYFSDLKANEVENDEPKAESKATNVPSYILGETDIQMIDQLPRIEAIGSEEISISAYDCDPDRLQLVCLYNKMCKTVENYQKLSARELSEVNVIKNFHQLEIISADVNRILNQQNQRSAETQVLNSDKSNTLSQTEVVGSGLLSSSQDKCKPEDVVVVSEPKKQSDQVTKISEDMGN